MFWGFYVQKMPLQAMLWTTQPGEQQQASNYKIIKRDADPAVKRSANYPETGKNISGIWQYGRNLIQLVFY